MNQRVCITTMVSGVYEWYIPLFIYCGTQAYPEYDFKVFLRGKTELPQSYRQYVMENAYVSYPHNGPTTAAVRFLEGEKELGDYDCCLITDVDILLMREEPELISQHLAHMEHYGLECYCNYQSHEVPDGIRCSGVHFITKDWWEKTREEREKWMFNAKNGRLSEKDSDEYMLGDIIQQSGLPDPPKQQFLWNHHGIHLRRWWPTNQQRHPGAQESLHMQKLLDSTDFMDLVDDCSAHLPKIKDIVGTMERVIKGK